MDWKRSAAADRYVGATRVQYGGDAYLHAPLPPSTTNAMSQVPAQPLEPLRTTLSETLRRGREDIGMEEWHAEMVRATASFLSDGWRAPSSTQHRRLQGLQTKGDQEAVRWAFEETADELDDVLSTFFSASEALGPERANADHPELPLSFASEGLGRLFGVVDRAQMRVLAIAAADHSWETVKATRRSLEELLRAAHIVYATRVAAMERNLEPSALTPALLAVVAVEQNLKGDADAALADYGLLEGTDLEDRPAVAEVARDLEQSASFMDEQVSAAFTLAERDAEEFLGRAPSPDEDARPPWEPPVAEETAPDYPPRLDLTSLLAQEAMYLGAPSSPSARDATDKRLVATFDLLWRHAAMARALYDLEDPFVSPYRLQTLEELVARGETVAHGLEERWRRLEQEMRYRRTEVVSPFDLQDVGARDARGMERMEAVRAGLPLGIALAELYDSDLTFGPNERRDFEALALVSAWRFAASPTAPEDPERTRVEIRLRELGSTDVDHLEEEGRHLLSQMSGRGEPALQDERFLDEAIDRILAHEELSRLLHLRALVGNKPDRMRGLVHGYQNLPHTRRFALAERPTPLRERTARNGQAFGQLESETRAAWKAHRLRAGPHRDVSSEIGDETRAGPSRRGGNLGKRGSNGMGR